MIRKILTIFIVVFLTSCSNNENVIDSPLSNEVIESISHVKEFHSLFVKVDNVQLSTGHDHAISVITDIELDSKGNILIADGWQAKGVYVFSPTGQFIKELGKEGQGPGEYLTPVSIAISPEGNIFVNDYMSKRVLVFDPEYQFIKFIILKGKTGHYIHCNTNQELYMYSSAKLPSGWTNSDTIYKYGQDGNLITSFAPLPEELKEINGSISQEGVAIDDQDHIFELNPLFYNIRKYDSLGKLIKSFSRTTDLFKIITDKDVTPIILNGPFYLEKGLIIVQLNGHLDIYDTKGNFLVGDIYFPQEIKCSHKNTIYIKDWDEEGHDVDVQNPKIISYELRI
ncbi:6-bladed beta-propeller [bacterium]|nr:6-bladed beta-propeller [bacterium]